MSSHGRIVTSQRREEELNENHSENYSQMYEEVDLMELIMVLWRKKWLIILLTLSFMLAAFIISKAISPTYEAVLSLRIREPFLANIPQLIPEKPTTAEVITLFQSPSIMKAVQERYGGESWEAIKNRLSIEAPDKTDIITLKATGENPAASVALVTTWADIATERYHAQATETLQTTLNELVSKYNSSKAELDQLRAEMTAFNETNNIQVLRKQLEVLTTTMVEYQNEMHELSIQIEELESKVNSYRDSLANRDSLARNTVSQEVIGAIAIVENESALAAARARKEAIEPLLASIEQQINQLQKDLATKQAAEQQLRSRIEQIETVHATLSRQYEQARLIQSVPLSYFQQIGEPIPPENPVKPRTLLNVAIAAVLGVFVGVGLALFLEYFDDYKKQQTGNVGKTVNV